MSAQDRAGPRPLPRHRPRPDQAEPEEVHPAGRDDREEGEGPRHHPGPAHRHPPLPLRRQVSRAASARATASPAIRSPRPTASRAAARPARARASTSSRSTSRSRSSPRSSARSSTLPAHRAARARTRSSPPRDQVHRHLARPARSRCATSSAPTSRPCRRQIATGTYNSRRPDRRPDPRGQALPHLEAGAAARDQRRHHLHDGRVRLDGRRAEGDRPHRVLLDRHLAAPPLQGRSRRRYIIHDAVAREVDRDTFFHTRESGGTMISLGLQAVPRRSSTADYAAGRVEHLPLPLLRRRQLERGRHPRLHRAPARTSMLPAVNLFGYGQVESPYGSRPVHQGPARGASAARENVALSRDRATRTPSTARSRSSSGRGSERRHEPTFAARTRQLAAAPRDVRAARSRATRASYGLDFFETIFEVLDLRRDERDRRLRRLSQPLPALAVRDGVRAALQGLRVRPLRRSTRWSSTTTPATPTCSSRNMDWSTRSWSWPTSTGTSTSSRTTSCSAHTNRKMMDADGQPRHPRSRRYHRQATAWTTVEDFIDRCLSLENLIDPPVTVREAPRRSHGPTASSRGDGEVARGFKTDQRVHGRVHQPARVPRGAAEEARTTRRAPEEDVPGAARARRAAVPARARAARALGARRPLDHPRGGLLLRPAGADQDHERGLGHLLALHDHDREGPRRLRDHRLRRPPLRHARHASPGSSTPTSSASSCSATSRTAGTRGSFGKEYDECDDLAAAQALGHAARAGAARRSSRSAASTTTSPSSTSS